MTILERLQALLYKINVATEREDTNLSDAIDVVTKGYSKTIPQKPYIEETYDNSGYLTNFKLNGYTTIRSNMFRGQKISIDSLPKGIKKIGEYAFSDCPLIKSFTISEKTDLSNGYIFNNCRNLKTVFLANDITSIGNSMFRGCSSLTDITLPNNITSIPAYCFYDCSSLANITLPNSITSIGDYAFYNCSSLANITLPNDITGIKSYTFYNCSSLTDITLPNSITNIGNKAFCKTKITNLIIPSSVLTLDSYLFSESSFLGSSTTSSLQEVIFKGKPASINPYAFYKTSNLVIKVPWAEGEVRYAPWGADNATIIYNYTEE